MAVKPPVLLRAGAVFLVVVGGEAAFQYTVNDAAESDLAAAFPDAVPVSSISSTTLIVGPKVGLVKLVGLLTV